MCRTPAFAFSLPSRFHPLTWGYEYDTIIFRRTTSIQPFVLAFEQE